MYKTFTKVQKLFCHTKLALTESDFIDAKLLWLDCQAKSRIYQRWRPGREAEKRIQEAASADIWMEKEIFFWLVKFNSQGVW